MGTKRRLPAWALWIVVGLSLIAFGWAGAVLYVKLRVAADIAALRTFSLSPPTGSYAAGERAIKGLLLHGCRALPALISELEPDVNAVYADTLGSLIHSAVLSSHGFERGTPQASAVIERMRGLRVDVTDSAEERKLKITALREWWKENGSAYHQGWRFWSTTCRAPLFKDF